VSLEQLQVEVDEYAERLPQKRSRRQSSR